MEESDRYRYTGRKELNTYTPDHKGCDPRPQVRRSFGPRLHVIPKNMVMLQPDLTVTYGCGDVASILSRLSRRR